MPNSTENLNFLVDLEHLHYWMSAIRDSRSPARTLDAFWKGQISSKLWLIRNLEPFVLENFGSKNINIDIHGGWVGVLSSMIFQSRIPVLNIRSVDIDSDCENVATTMNKIEEIQGRFKAITADMCLIEPEGDIIINTSCEHITQQQYNDWIKKISTDKIIVLQSNNYDIPEHVRIAKNLSEFRYQCNINVLWEGELKTQLYTRYMIIGNRK